MNYTLVTGASGLLGSAIIQSERIRSLSKTEIISVTRMHLRSEEKFCISSDYSMESAKKIIADYPAKIKNIIHCAGLPSVYMSLLDPMSDHFNNFNPILFSLEIARKTGAKIFYISSVELYGSTSCEGRTEDSIKCPKNPYALNKMFAEEQIKLYHKLYGVEFNVLRPGIFIGENIRKNIIFEIISTYQNQLSEIKIYVDLKSKFNFIHVCEVTEVIEFLMEKNITNEVLNVGLETSVSVEELLNYFEKRYNFIPKIKQLDTEYQYKTAPIQKIKNLGWKPKRDIFFYLDELVKVKMKNH